MKSLHKRIYPLGGLLICPMPAATPVIDAEASGLCTHAFLPFATKRH